EELTLEVLDAQFAHRLDDLQERLAAAPFTPEGRVDAFAVWWQDLLLIEGWGRVIVEFATATRDNPEVQAALADRQRAIAAYATGIMANEAERFGIELATSAEWSAMTLVALGEGLTFARMLDPE